MRQAAGFIASYSYRRIWIVSTAILLVYYFVICFTPFRLTNDTVRYFALLEDFQGTWPAAFEKPRDFLPYGYVYFLAGLSKLHLLTPFGIAFFQLLYLCGSLYFVKKLFGASLNTWPFVFFTLLNWTTVKFAITPLSEMQFLFFSTATLYCYQLFMTQKKVWLLGLTIVLCFICFITRTAGVALVLALLISFLISIRSSVAARLRQQPLYAAMVVLVLCLLLGFLVTRPKFITYLSYFFNPLVQDPFAFFSRNLRLHCTDWAELFINIPLSKTSFLISPAIAGFLYVLTGIFFLGWVAYRLISHRTLIPLPVIVYLIIYILLIFNWPFFEARFWFPLLPFIAAILLQRSRTGHGWYAKVGAGYALYYVATGFFVVGYYARLSFDQEYLMRKHDAGKWQVEYEAHFGIRQPADPSRVNQKALYILHKYD